MEDVFSIQVGGTWGRKASNALTSWPNSQRRRAKYPTFVELRKCHMALGRSGRTVPSWHCKKRKECSSCMGYIYIYAYIDPLKPTQCRTCKNILYGVSGYNELACLMLPLTPLKGASMHHPLLPSPVVCLFTLDHQKQGRSHDSSHAALPR